MNQKSISLNVYPHPFRFKNHYISKILLILFMNEIHFLWSWASHLSIYRIGRQKFFRHSTCLNKLLWIMMEAFGLHYSFFRSISKLKTFDLFPYMNILFTILWRDTSLIYKPFHSMHPLYHKVWWRKHIQVIPRCGVEIANVSRGTITFNRFLSLYL